MGLLGQLAVHMQQVRPAWADEDRSTQLVGARYTHQLCGAMVGCISFGSRYRGSTDRRSYIKSAIRSPEYEAQLTSKGVEFAPQEDVAMCMMKLATDQSINGECMKFVLQ